MLPDFAPAGEAYFGETQDRLFVSAKDPKTIDAPSGLMRGDDVSLWKVDQLAEPVLSFIEGLKQGPPADESIPPLGQTAGVGQWGRTFQGLMKVRGSRYLV